MKLSCSTSAFKQPLEEALPRISALGFTQVDLLCIPQWPHLEADKLAADFDGTVAATELLLERTNLDPSALNCALPTLHERDDPDKNAQRLEYARVIARLCARWELPAVSLYPGYWDATWSTYDEILARTAETARELVAIGQEFGAQFCIEPHFKTAIDTPAAARELLESVPGFGVVYDPSHFAAKGCDPHDGGDLIAASPHIHLRDAKAGELQAPAGSGDVDFPWILRQLKARGYTGALAIEVLGKEGIDVEAELRAYLKLLQPLL